MARMNWSKGRRAGKSYEPVGKSRSTQERSAEMRNWDKLLKGATDADVHLRADAALLRDGPREQRLERFAAAARISQDAREHLLGVAAKQERLGAEPVPSRVPLPTLYPDSSLNLRRAHARAIVEMRDAHVGSP